MGERERESRRSEWGEGGDLWPLAPPGVVPRPFFGSLGREEGGVSGTTRSERGAWSLQTGGVARRFFRDCEGGALETVYQYMCFDLYLGVPRLCETEEEAQGLSADQSLLKSPR
jgi:hypothetical protein